MKRIAFAGVDHDDVLDDQAKGDGPRTRGDRLPTLEAEVLDSRVMVVLYDDPGQRFRPWRDVIPALIADEDHDWPVEGPRTVMWLCKQFSRSSLGPLQWLERPSQSGRARAVEEMSRRWQTIMEVDADNPVQPDYEAAEYITGRHRQASGVAPELRSHVARLMKEDAEVKKQLGRELMEAASASKSAPPLGKK